MEFLPYIGIGITLALIVSGLAFSLYVGGLVAQSLAKRDILFTIIPEGEAKAVMENGSFRKFLMSYTGHGFARDIPGDSSITSSDPADDWRIVNFKDEAEARPQNARQISEAQQLPTWKKMIPSFLRNIYWIGIPPFAEIHTYRFSWTSLEEANVSGKMVQQEKFSEKYINTILVQEDVYVTHLDKAECKDNIPLDAMITFLGQIKNPYLALFGVERWLEATVNILNANMRTFFGQHTYAELQKVQADQQTDAIMAFLAPVLEKILEEFGFEIKRVEIQKLDPGSELAQEFIRASTQLYVAQQKAEAVKAESEGERSRIKGVYPELAGIPGALENYKWEQIAKSGLRTYVEGSAKTGINVGVDSSDTSERK